MKKLRITLLTFIGAAALSNVACAQKVNDATLPAPVKKFIEAHFPAPKYHEIEVDREHSGVIMYDIDIKGAELKIDQNGVWKKVNCERNPVPEAIVPASIRQYVATNYPDKVLSEIERENNGYTVELSSKKKVDILEKDIKLLFDIDGHFQAVGND